jgi:DNA-binding response OmpR family regulator
MITQPSILIATSDTLLAEAYKNRLRHLDFIIDSITDGTRVLNQILKAQPNLIVLDSQLQVHGHDILEIIRETPETAHTKVIIITPLITSALRKRFAELGVNHVEIHSPATIEKVVEQITREVEHDDSGSKA